MIKSKSSLGMAKHRNSGRTPKSPKLWHFERIMAERNEKKSVATCHEGSIKQLLEKTK